MNSYFTEPFSYFTDYDHFGIRAHLRATEPQSSETQHILKQIFEQEKMSQTPETQYILKQIFNEASLIQTPEKWYRLQQIFYQPKAVITDLNIKANPYKPTDQPFFEFQDSIETLLE